MGPGHTGSSQAPKGKWEREGETVGTVTPVEKEMKDFPKPSLRARKSVIPHHGSQTDSSRVATVPQCCSRNRPTAPSSLPCATGDVSEVDLWDESDTGKPSINRQPQVRILPKGITRRWNDFSRQESSS